MSTVIQCIGSTLESFLIESCFTVSEQQKERFNVKRWLVVSLAWADLAKHGAIFLRLQL